MKTLLVLIFINLTVNALFLFNGSGQTIKIKINNTWIEQIEYGCHFNIAPPITSLVSAHLPLGIKPDGSYYLSKSDSGMIIAEEIEVLDA